MMRHYLCMVLIALSLGVGVAIASEQISLDQQLIDAARKGDVNLVNELIEGGADINFQDRFGKTPLAVAASNSHIELVAGIIGKAADLNLGKVPPLVAAASVNNPKQVEIVRLLILNGADIHQPRQDDLTPIHLAAMHGHIKVVEELISAGADVNALSWEGNTPLDLARLKKRPDIEQLLESFGGTPATSALKRKYYTSDKKQLGQYILLPVALLSFLIYFFVLRDKSIFQRGIQGKFKLWMPFWLYFVPISSVTIYLAIVPLPELPAVTAGLQKILRTSFVLVMYMFSMLSGLVVFASTKNTQQKIWGYVARAYVVIVLSSPVIFVLFIVMVLLLFVLKGGS